MDGVPKFEVHAAAEIMVPDHRTAPRRTVDLHFHGIGAELWVAGDEYFSPRLMHDGVNVVLRLDLENGAGWHII